MNRSLLALPLALLLAAPAQAGNVTQQQTCQLMARHVVGILESRDWRDEAAGDIGVLKLYAVAQGEIIAEETAASAEQLSMPLEEVKAMVDAQGETLKATMEKRYGTEALYRDYAVSLFNCAKMSPERLGSPPEKFAATLERIGKWAQEER